MAHLLGVVQLLGPTLSCHHRATRFALPYHLVRLSAQVLVHQLVQVAVHQLGQVAVHRLGQAVHRLVQVVVRLLVLK